MSENNTEGPATHLAGLRCPSLKDLGAVILIGTHYGDPLKGNNAHNNPQEVVDITAEGTFYRVDRKDGTHFLVPKAMCVPVWRLDDIEVQLQKCDIIRLGRMLFEKGIGKGIADAEAKDFADISERAIKHGQMQEAKDKAAISRVKYLKTQAKDRLEDVRDDEGNLPTDDTVDAAMTAGLDDEEESDGGEMGKQLELARGVIPR